MFGKKDAGDSRVTDILTSANIKYEVDPDGDYRVVFGFEDGRSQLAFINSSTENFVGTEIREIWSVGIRGKEPFSAAVANSLLEKNSHYKIGGWELVHQDEEILAVFKVPLSADASESELTSALQTVAIQADEVEKEFVGSDDL